MTNEQTPTKTKGSTKTRTLGFADLRDEMDRLWETLSANPWQPFRGFAQIKPTPSMDVFQKDGALHIRTELPGIEEKDVEVEVTADAVTISGEKKEEREVKEKDYYRSERRYGSFKRQIALPPGANKDKATAVFKNGVLEIDLPLAAVEPAKKIQISSAN